MLPHEEKFTIHYNQGLKKELGIPQNSKCTIIMFALIVFAILQDFVRYIDMNIFVGTYTHVGKSTKSKIDFGILKV